MPFKVGLIVRLSTPLRVARQADWRVQLVCFDPARQVHDAMLLVIGLHGCRHLYARQHLRPTVDRRSPLAERLNPLACVERRRLFVGVRAVLDRV